MGDKSGIVLVQPRPDAIANLSKSYGGWMVGVVGLAVTVLSGLAAGFIGGTATVGWLIFFALALGGLFVSLLPQLIRSERKLALLSASFGRLESECQMLQARVEQIEAKGGLVASKVQALEDEKSVLKAEIRQKDEFEEPLPTVKSVLAPNHPYQDAVYILRVSWPNSGHLKTNTALTVHLDDGMERDLGVAVFRTRQDNGDCLFTVSEVPRDSQQYVDLLLNPVSGADSMKRLRLARGVVLSEGAFGPSRMPYKFASPPVLPSRGRFA